MEEMKKKTIGGISCSLFFSILGKRDPLPLSHNRNIAHLQKRLIRYPNLKIFIKDPDPKSEPKVSTFSPYEAKKTHKISNL